MPTESGSGHREDNVKQRFWWCLQLENGVEEARLASESGDSTWGRNKV